MKRVLLVAVVVALLGIGAGRTAALRAEPLPAAGLGCDVDPAELVLSPVERQVLTALSTYRAERGVAALEVSPTLARAAVWKATAIASGAPRTHDDDGRSWHVRLNDCGYNFIATKGENLGQLDLDQAAAADPPVDAEAGAIIAAWRTSVAHEPLLSNPSFRVVGVARVRSGRVISWAMTFGSATDEQGVTPARLAGVQLPPPEIDPCLPAESCRGETLALWLGDPEAWRPRLEADGQPVIDAAVILRTLYYRRAAGSLPSAALLQDLGLE